MRARFARTVALWRPNFTILYVLQDCVLSTRSPNRYQYSSQVSNWLTAYKNKVTTGYLDDDIS